MGPVETTVLPLPLLLKQCHRKPDKTEGVNKIQSLLTGYSKCPSVNQKSFTVYNQEELKMNEKRQ